MPPNNQPPAAGQAAPQQPAPAPADAAQAMPPQQQQPGQAPQPAPGVATGQPAQPNPGDGKAPDKKATNQTTTQKSLLFSELRDSMIIMADGSFRTVIACQSINFDLMSSREREGVEYSYQNFLNSLSFDIQIFIRSQRVDIAPYIDKLEGIRRSQDNMLLNVLMDDYIGFVESLAEEANIMDKSFYIVIPHYSTTDASKLVEQSKGFFTRFMPQSSPGVTKIDKITYEKAQDEMKNRVESVMSGLFQIGVQSAQLNTKELGELYYNVYNPDTSVNQPLGDFEKNTSTFVRKGEGEAPRVNLQPGSME